MLDYKLRVTFYFSNQNAAQQARIDAVYFVSPLFCHPARAGPGVRADSFIPAEAESLIKVSNLPLCAQLGPHTPLCVPTGPALLIKNKFTPNTC